jgi:hypothetical protein
MNHLKVAASVVNLAILISCSISCSSAPPASTASTNIPAVAAGRAMLSSSCPDSVVNGKAPMLGAVGLQQRLKLAIQLPLAIRSN